MSFLGDLKEGKEFEHTVLEIVRQRYPTESWEINTEKKGVDIVSSTCNKTIEVKFDRMANDTWNLFIEVECNGKPSWINAYENMDVYAYGTKDKLFLFNTKGLRYAIDNQSFRKIKGWDWWRVTWVLIPITIGEKLANKIITYDSKN